MAAKGGFLPVRLPAGILQEPTFEMDAICTRHGAAEPCPDHNASAVRMCVSLTAYAGGLGHRPVRQKRASVGGDSDNIDDTR